jgi:two-component system chemotaxis sensor kinase CheA
MKLGDDLLRELLATFAVEAAEHIHAINAHLLALEKGPEPDEARELLAEIFREAHSLKGAARAVDLEAVGGLAHSLESLFGRMQAGELAASPELFDLAYQAMDGLTVLVAAGAEGAGLVDTAGLSARLDAAGSPPPPHNRRAGDAGRAQEPAPGMKDEPETEQPANGAWAAEAAVPETAVATLDAAETALTAPGAAARSLAQPAARPRLADETIRVSTAKLDALMAEVGELQIARLATEQRLAELRDLSENVEQLERNDAGWRAARTQLNDVRRRFEIDARRLAQLTALLQDDVRRTRLLPISTVFDAFPRMVRDVARDLGKEAELIVIGGDTEVDRSVLEQIKDPLIHLLRNSLDHGLEPPAVRRAAGKPAQGTITLSAAQHGSSVRIEVADDGAGIPVARVKASAVRQGVLTPEAAEALGEREALWLIFRSGLSTSPIVSDLSGRGVGLDVVRENIERLTGSLEVESEAGSGTRFILSLPLTVATTLCLLAQAGGQTFGLPITSVVRIVRLAPGDIGHGEGAEAIQLDGRPVALFRLAEILELSAAPPAAAMGARMPAVVLGSGTRRAAFLVDGLSSAQEVLVKSLPAPWLRVRHVAGATIMGNGEVVMILNAGDLLRSASRGPARGAPMLAAPAEAARAPAILVADDSITTRTLEKSILETAGYSVRVAADGLEAWALLQTETFDLLVSDVKMPRLDGFGLTEKVRADERLKTLPVILVTSLDSREDREHGVWAGADAYIVKTSFDQDVLLATIRKLI